MSPATRFGVLEPELGYASHGGQLTTAGPVLGNRFVQPQIRQLKPEFAYKKPQLSFRRPQAATLAPENQYVGPKIQQKWIAPQPHLVEPVAKSKLLGPVPDLKVKDPVFTAKTKAPQPHYAHYTEKAW